jgi:hypothetical protein
MNLASASQLLARVDCPDQRDEANEIWISAGIPKRSNSSGKTRSAPRESKTPVISMRRFAPRFSRYPAIILQSAEVGVQKPIENQLLMRTVLNPRSAEVWRQTGREREFRVSDGSSQWGGLCNNACGYWRSLRAKPRQRMLISERLAEREGFEPSIRFPVYTLSKRAP